MKNVLGLVLFALLGVFGCEDKAVDVPAPAVADAGKPDAAPKEKAKGKE